MNRAKVFERRKNNIEINTYIGGVSTNVYNKYILASKLGLNVTKIKKFKIVGNDLECAIDDNYTLFSYRDQNDIITGSFAPDGITYFKDLGGNVLNLGESAFRNCPNLTEVEFPSLIQINGNQNNTSGCFKDSISFTTFIADNLEALIGNNHFKNTNLTNANFPSLKTLNSNTCFRTTPFTNYDFPSLTSIGSINLGTAYTNTANFPILNNLSSGAFTGFGAVTLDLPSVTRIYGKTYTFSKMSNIQTINLKNLTYFANPANDGGSSYQKTFYNINSGCEINIHEYNATSNNGSADASLVYAKNQRNATINFYNNNGNFVSTL